MVTLAVTSVAALKLAFPAWFAVSVHVPTVTKVGVAPLVPLVVQILGLVEAKVTGEPDEAVAVRVIVFPGGLAIRRLLPKASNSTSLPILPSRMSVAVRPLFCVPSFLTL